MWHLNIFCILFNRVAFMLSCYFSYLLNINLYIAPCKASISTSVLKCFLFCIKFSVLDDSWNILFKFQFSANDYVIYFPF